MFFDLLGIEDVILPIEYCFICFCSFSEEFFSTLFNTLKPTNIYLSYLS